MPPKMKQPKERDSLPRTEALMEASVVKTSSVSEVTKTSSVSGSVSKTSSMSSMSSLESQTSVESGTLSQSKVKESIDQKMVQKQGGVDMMVVPMPKHRDIPAIQEPEPTGWLSLKHLNTLLLRLDLFFSFLLTAYSTFSSSYSPCNSFYSPCSSSYSPGSSSYSPCTYFYFPCSSYYSHCTSSHSTCSSSYSPCSFVLSLLLFLLSLLLVLISLLPVLLALLLLSSSVSGTSEWFTTWRKTGLDRTTLISTLLSMSEQEERMNKEQEGECIFARTEISFLEGRYKTEQEVRWRSLCPSGPGVAGREEQSGEEDQGAGEGGGQAQEGGGEAREKVN